MGGGVEEGQKPLFSSKKTEQDLSDVHPFFKTLYIHIYIYRNAFIYVYQKEKTITGCKPDSTRLSASSEVVWESSVVLLQRTLLGQELDESTVVLDLTGISPSDVLSSVQVGETPLLGDDDLLLTWELVSGSSQTLNNDVLVGILGSDREDDLTDIDSGSQTVRLTPGTSHTLLKSICTSTRQHLVDSQDVEWVNSDSQVESISTGHLSDVLVSTDTSSFQSLRGQLLQLVRDKVDTERKLIDGSLLLTQIVDLDLGLRNSSVVPRLWVRLVLLVSVTSSWSSSHFE